MNTTRGTILLSMIGVMCIVMVFLYVNFQADKPRIIAEQQQNNQPVLTWDQMSKGIQNFADTVKNNTSNPPSIITNQLNKTMSINNITKVLP